MAFSSRRKSRPHDFDDDEDLSRQSTPASTAPYDGKRVRRSLARVADNDSDMSSTDSATTTSMSKSQYDHKPPLGDSVRSSTQPRHQPGAIVRVKLTNFVTYTSAEFFPGPNLNMVIGPNGTGKSTLVCAICLGLGWGTQYLGRAKDAAEFVKHGCREASIEIELQRALKGPNATRSNPIITRTIKREGNKSSYTLNGQSASGKAVVQLATSFDIQIDNLCQFLPQDKVVEFAQMTPIEMLQSTQRAAAPPEMAEMHEKLKNMRKTQKESNDSKKSDREMLANLENRQEMQRIEVERLRERVAVQKRLGWLQKCRPIPLYAEAKVRRTEAKQRQKDIGAELRQLKDESGPTLKKVEAKRLYVKKVKAHKEQREKEVKTMERECDRLARSIENHETMHNDCTQIEAAEKKSLPTIRGDISRSRTQVALLKKRKEQEPEPFDSRAMNQEIQARVNRSREIDDRLEELKSVAGDLQQQRDNRKERRKELLAKLKALDTQVGQQEDALKEQSSDSHRAWAWIKENRKRFQQEVYGPPMIECTMKDPSVANRIEALFQQNDFRIFTVQCREDFRLLQEELIQKQRLHDVSIRTCPHTSLDSFRPPLSADRMQECGLKGWAIDFLQGPPSVLAMLCQEKFLHQCAMTDKDTTQAQHDQLAVIPGVKGYVSNAKSYQFIRRAEYGAAGISAKEKTLRRAQIWTNQPSDSGRKQQIEADIKDLQRDIEEIRLQFPVLEKEKDELEAEKNKVREELGKLKAEKDYKQKALVEFNGLDTKIAQEEEKIVRCQENLETMNARLTENKAKQDEAMFAKADAVLEYCAAVHKLQEATKALLETEVAYIEALNDFEVLCLRNENIVKLLEQKQKELEEAMKTAEDTKTRAQQLVEEIKRLRDHGLNLEKSENDRGLTDILEELSDMQGPKVGDLEDLIKVEEARLDLTEGGDTSTIQEFEERAQKIEQLRSRLARMNAQQEEVMDSIREMRGRWEPPLDALVARISDAFGDSFARIGCAGQVVVYKASSDDPVDCTEDLGGSGNGLDFGNWAIHISVKFRENEALSLLDSHRQSGGERAVSTIFYLMALQSLSRAPFRVVDEINQGMDPRNERMVHGRMVDIAAAGANGHEQGSQYFLITPKLLSGLKYKAGMTVLCIVSGENMPSAGDTKVKDDTGKWVMKRGKKIDFVEFVRMARQLALTSGGGQSVGKHQQNDTSSDRFETLGRRQASVGA